VFVSNVLKASNDTRNVKSTRLCPRRALTQAHVNLQGDVVSCVVRCRCIVFRMAGADRAVRALLRTEWIVHCTFGGGGWIVGQVGCSPVG
jgi:hypothetical protein